MLYQSVLHYDIISGTWLINTTCFQNHADMLKLSSRINHLKLFSPSLPKSQQRYILSLIYAPHHWLTARLTSIDAAIDEVEK